MGTTRCKKHEDDYQRSFYTYTQVESEKPGEEDTKKIDGKLLLENKVVVEL